MANSFFISDLHLFSRRSCAGLWEDRFRAAIEQSHTFILGGDIFDFRWSTQQTLQHAVDDAMEWLRELLRINANCSFHYLLGNHDCHPDFIAALKDLSYSTANFVWHRHFLRIENSVFLHGDVVDAKVRAGQNFDQILDAKRLAGELRDPPKALSHALYDVAVRARVHRLVVQIAKPNELVLRKLIHYLKLHDLTAESGVTDVYFGHTHRRLNAIPYEGMRFYNPGAAIKGLPFNMIEATVNAVPLASWK
ncbi:MAG: metallophosphoesterase [Pirellulales bacterium]